MEANRQWRYIAENNRGDIVRGALAAADFDNAVAQLKDQGFAPIDLEEENAASGRLFLTRKRLAALSENDMTLFCTRMSDLLNAGVVASKALSLIAEQSSRASLKNFATRLQSRIRKGELLSQALANDPTEPPRLMVALAASGEALGDLGGQFARLAAAFETRAALRKEIISQLIYPAALFILIVLTLIFLSFLVLPQFESVFATSGAAPPPETQFVLVAGAAIRAHWLTAAAGLVAAIAGARVFARRHRSRAEALLLAAPVVGTLVRKLETARYCRSLGELLCGGMPLARAMPIARAAISNGRIRRSAGEIEKNVRNGAQLSRAARDVGGFHGEVGSFFELGEETGDLGVMTAKAADYLEQQITTGLKRFAALSGPIMTAIMGLLTAGVIAAVMAGVLSLNDTVY